MFEYYCRHFGFDCVEINSSFYQMPAAASMASLARRSPEDFRFMVKGYQAFTHNLHEATLEAFQRFRQGIAPLAETGKLRGVLAQFPSAFRPDRKAAAWLRFLRDRFAPFPLFVEFRHRDWDRPRCFDYLRHQRIGYCITDLPRLYPLPAFLPVVTNGVAYLRMHGRNRDWRRPSTSRYDYAYTDDELHFVLGRIKAITPASGEIYIFFNNCHCGHAVRSGRRFQELLRLTQLGMSLS